MNSLNDASLELIKTDRNRSIEQARLAYLGHKPLVKVFPIKTKERKYENYAKQLKTERGEIGNRIESLNLKAKLRKKFGRTEKSERLGPQSSR